LTKVHQEFLLGTALELAKRLNAPRGEFTIVVGPRGEEANVAQELPPGDGLVAEFRQLTENDGCNRRQAIAQLARKYDRPSREVYARLEAAKGRVS
jgi:16S rRNA C1402 (ribose-2'-O) methylase RsmI